MSEEFLLNGNLGYFINDCVASNSDAENARQLLLVEDGCAAVLEGELNVLIAPTIAADGDGKVLAYNQFAFADTNVLFITL